MAAAAYRAGERLRDERTGYLYDYAHRKEAARISSWIMAPDGSPSWAGNRSKLWNRAEAAEKRINSRPAREAEVSLPVGLNREQQDELLRGWVREQFVSRGMVADVCVHRGHAHNPHAHIMLTTRELDGDGFAPSKATEAARSWDGPGRVDEMRESWAVHQNQRLKEAGRPERVDHRSYRERGILREPTIHEGPQVRAMEERGIYTERGAINRGVKYRNEERLRLLDQERQMEEATMQHQREEEARQQEEAEQQAQEQAQAEQQAQEAQREEEASEEAAHEEEERQVEERRREREEREAAELEEEHEREM